MRRRGEKVVKGKIKWHRASQVRKIKITMSVIAVILCISVAAGALLVWIQLKQPSKVPYNSTSLNSTEIENDILPEYDNSFNLAVVNASNKINPDFKVQLEDYEGVKVDTRIIPALNKMMNDAASEGYKLKLLSGYISIEEQDKLFSQEVQKLISSGSTQVRAENQAQTTIGKGGYNEKQTGMAVEFTSEKTAENGDFSSTDEYRWLQKNCVNYGFVLRYPETKISVTGRNFNPRYFRYVGKDNAVKMRSFSMCLEEYATYIRQQTP